MMADVTVSDGGLLTLQAMASSALLLAGSSKLVGPQGIQDTLGRLLDRSGITWAQARALGGLEILLAAALLVYPSPILGVALMLFGVMLGGVGAFASLTGQTIPCNCFGGMSERSIGKVQVLQAPVWIGLGWLSLAPTDAFDADARLLALACSMVVALLIVLTRLARLVNAPPAADNGQPWFTTAIPAVSR